jgi:hypothetical protein
MVLGAAVCVLLLGAGAARGQATRFAVIGDYGAAGAPEADVAALVKSWSPAFIVTTGDNNYDNGAAATIDTNIGKYYHDFIYPYTGSYGAGASENRFFPCLGNHDWVATNAQPYLDYFALPGIERYYDFVRGPVHFYALDVDPHEPDGIDSNSVQAVWLKGRLAASPEQWKIVYMHHSPYSSCSRHGSYPVLQWPYARWGASAVFSGHDHTYERISQSGIPYFVNGLGGKSIYAFTTPVPGSQVRFNGDYGAMLVDADADSVIFRFITRAGAVADRYGLYRPDTAAVGLAGAWNLLSLPMLTGRTPTAVLFPGAISRAFVFRGGDFVIVDSLEPGEGFWLKFPGPQTAAITGDSLLSATVTLAKGWNIVGGLSVPVPAASLVQDPPGNLMTPFYAYRGTYLTADTLQPGSGYWVRAAQGGTIFLTAPGSVK